MKKKRFISNSLIIKNQKGLSAIVATLIIILLVLVAVGIIWVVVRSIVQEGAERIELGRFTLDLEIKSVQIGDDDVTVIVVKRNPGEGNFIGMNFIFSDGTNTEIIRENTTLEETEEKSFTFILTEISIDDLKTVSVIPIFELSSGKESAGDIVDSFDISEEIQMGGNGDSGPVGNFEALGFEGVGIVNYSVSSSGDVWPKFKRAVVDPLDVSPGDNQTFTAYVYSPYDIVSVTTITQLDNGVLNLDLEKIDEYEENQETIEIWSANWTVYDTHLTTYRTTFIATDSETNENNITLSWTDACEGITQGQDSTLSTYCPLGAGSVGGVDDGHLTIASGGNLQLTGAGSIWAFNQGKSIIMGGGTISIDGGSITKGYLYYIDHDGDSYAVNTELSFENVSSYAGKIRTSSGSLLGTNDCNDDNSGDWRYRYSDSDGDGHCPSSGQTCVGNDAGYVDSCTSYNDCYDSNANAKPGQLTYYTAHRGDNSWDYNCDNYQTQQWTTTGGGCWDCWYDYQMFYCDKNLPDGKIGWEGAAPNCGDSGTYYTNPGPTCSSRGGDEWACEQSCYGASYGAKTQACR